eukprot:EG_transcript_15806
MERSSHTEGRPWLLVVAVGMLGFGLGRVVSARSPAAAPASLSLAPAQSRVGGAATRTSPVRRAAGAQRLPVAARAEELEAHTNPSKQTPASAAAAGTSGTAWPLYALVGALVSFAAARTTKPWAILSTVAEGLDLSRFRPVTHGGPGSPDYSVYLQDGDTVVSPWHDVPFQAGEGVFCFVNEIPKGSTPKLEVSTKVPQNPIRQDVKNGKLRHLTYDMGVGSSGIPFNYGMLPQTFEDPTVAHKDTGCVGDADPIDVVEISPEPMAVGEVRKVKILGCLAMIDEGETDWKLIGIDVAHPRAALLHSIEDMSSPEDMAVLDSVRKWFRMYKTPDGKGENSFAFNGQYRGRDYALRIIEEVHGSWRQLLAGRLENKKGWAL